MRALQDTPGLRSRRRGLESAEGNVRRCGGTCWVTHGGNETRMLPARVGQRVGRDGAGRRNLGAPLFLCRLVVDSSICCWVNWSGVHLSSWLLLSKGTVGLDCVRTSETNGNEAQEVHWRWRYTRKFCCCIVSVRPRSIAVFERGIEIHVLLEEWFEGGYLWRHLSAG